MKTAKAIINFLLSLLAVAKWIPFLGKYKEIVIVASAVLSTIAGMLAKCDTVTPATPEPAKTESPTPTPTLTHTPSPTPSPVPTPEIVVDRVPQAGWPFTVRYTAPFKYNIHLWADKWRLQVFGQEYKTGHMIAPAVILKNPGKRVLTVRDYEGNILASKTIEVMP